MAIRVKPLDEMISDVITSLQVGAPRQPAFTLLIGSGFSFPIIPTPTEMLRGDIAWWRYCKAKKIDGGFRHRADVIAERPELREDVLEFERKMWKEIHGKATETTFPLADGLPDLRDPTAIGYAYQAVMADGLLNNKMRRQYLRDAIARSYPKVNGAHIFLAGILEAQESWDHGAPFCRTIFTTNFDPLLQRSLQLVNKLYYMTDRPDVLEPPDDDESDAIHLVYTHGSVHRYDLLNTEEQIKHARERNAPTLIEYFRRHGVIVIGYSGWSDTTMEALSACSAFDSNLYWCDIHPAANAEARLRPEVLKILQARERNAFYVSIPGADEMMQQLHRELRLGDIPKFILAPVGTMIDQLQSIQVPADNAAIAGTELTQLSPTLATLLEGTLTRLSVAKSAFDDPSIVQPTSPQGQEDVAKALVAQLMSDALLAYSEGKHEHAITLWSTVIATEVVPVEDRAKALFNRGVSWGKSGDSAKAIVDYTTVIEMANAPVRHRAKALYNRGAVWGDNDETAKEIADYTAVVDMADAPAEQKAKALRNRGVAWRQLGDTPKAIADYTTVIEMADAPPAQRAAALNNRGFAWGTIDEFEKAIADYSSVIQMPDALVEQKAIAYRNRGLDWDRIGESTKAIADFTSVIELPDAPPDQKAMAFSNRAFVWRNRGEAANEIADFTAMIEMTNAPAEQKAKALYNRGVALQRGGENDKALADYTAAIEMADAPAEQKAMSLNQRGLIWRQSGDTERAIADYTTVIEMIDAPLQQKATALNRRAYARGKSGDATEEIADYAAVIEMEGSTSDQKASAFLNRGWTLFANRGDVRSLVEDSRRALELNPEKHSARSNLALGLLLLGDPTAAQATYEELLAKTSDESSIQEAITDLEMYLPKDPPIPEAAQILERLKGALPAPA